MKKFGFTLSIIILYSSTILGQEKYQPLPKVDINQIQHYSNIPEHSMKYDPLIQDIISQTNLDSLITYVRILSGEDSVWVNGSRVRIQHRVSDLGNDLVADFLKQKLETFSLDVYDQIYSSDGRNVYAIQPGYLYPEKQYIICAHYDAVDDYCADDNASGVAAVLETARILSQYDFKYTLIYALWDEEEIGLLGSHYYASRAQDIQSDIRGVINLDMIGWDSDQDRLLDIHSSEIANTNTLANLFIINNFLYDLPLSPVIYNPGTWQSDHSSFWDYGYGAVLVIEAYYGGDLNPYYHSIEDRLDKFDLSYFHNISKLSISVISTLVEITEDTLIVSVSPDGGYQKYHTEIVIDGSHTNFLEGYNSLKIWLSKDSDILLPDTVYVQNNTSLIASFYLPGDASPGWWDVNAENDIDGLLTKESSFEILPSPALISVSPDTLNITIESNTMASRVITIHNIGDCELNFNIISQGRNNALQFDGINSEVLLGDTALDITGDISLCAWFKTSSSQWGSIISNFDQHIPDNGYELCVGSLYETGGFIYFEFAENDVKDGFSTNNSFNDGQWHFVSAVLSPDGFSKGKVYVDGIKQSGYDRGLGRDPIPSIGKTPEYPLKFGAASNRTGPEVAANFEGIIDEIRIWDKALNQQEIQANMYKKLTGLEVNLVGYWNFDGVRGDSVYDLTASGNHGSLRNGVTWVSDNAPVGADWISVVPETGICAVGSTVEITVYFDARELDPGEHSGMLILSSNDPFSPRVTIPIHLTVVTFIDIAGNLNFPKEFGLYQNYPNPFNPVTMINYQLPMTNKVDLSIYNILGEKLVTLVNKKQPAGRYEVEWDASNYSSGVYLYRLSAGSITTKSGHYPVGEAGEYIETRKMILLK